jgi:DNA-directed RNA polymerase specialized sigma24 family protein
MPTSATYFDLRELLNELEGQPNTRPEVIWTSIVQHPWYVHQVPRIARNVRRRWRVDCPIEDIVHRAIEQLGKELQRNPALLHGAPRVPEEFARWLRGLIRNHCRKAVRSWCRRRPLVGLSPQAAPQIDPWTAVDMALDQQTALERIEEPTRSLLRQWLDGFALDEISQAADLSYQQVRRRIRAGLVRMRRLLRDYIDRP